MSMTYGDLMLVGKLVDAQQQLKNLKATQRYAVSQVGVASTYYVDIPLYNYTFFDNLSGRNVTVRQAAASLTFAGADGNKTALVNFNATPSDLSHAYRQAQSLILTQNEKHILEYRFVWSMMSNATGYVRVTAYSNMPGSFTLNQTYNVPIT